jgi:RimJ/RimL family protein N-acetyltransferase
LPSVMLSGLPNGFETARLSLRSYAAGDGAWYFAVGQKNHAHLERYESGNVIFGLKSVEEAEAAVQGMQADWAARRWFFLGAFEKARRDKDLLSQFVAQIYIGPVDQALPEYEIGYFVDVDQEGQGFVTEAVQGALGFTFEHLHAHRVRIECCDTNLRSARVAERCGFVLEGHLRENHCHAGGIINGTLIYGLLHSEYELLCKIDSPS